MSDVPSPEDATADFQPPIEEPPEVAQILVEYVLPEGAYGSIVADDGLAAYLREPAILAEAVPAPESPGALAAIRDLGDALGKRLDALQSLFEREARAESSRERVVDRLHAELQEYKQGLLLGILRPVFVDLIQLHDDMGKMIAASGEVEGESGRLLGLIASFQQGVEDILYRQGVEPFTEPGDAFDPRRQRALSTVSTDDPALNKTVAARLRKGFQTGEKVVRPEMVTVYSFKPRPPEAADPA